MKLEVLMSCMHQTDDTLVRKSCLTGNVVMVNQCQEELYQEFRTERGMLRMFSCTERGLTKSRNRAIKESNADICLLCDDDEIFLPDYEPDILQAYRNLPEADIIIFKMTNYPEKFKNKVMRLRFPQTMHVASWQTGKEDLARRRERYLQSANEEARRILEEAKATADQTIRRINKLADGAGMGKELEAERTALRNKLAEAEKKERFL